MRRWRPWFLPSVAALLIIGFLAPTARAADTDHYARIIKEIPLRYMHGTLSVGSDVGIKYDAGVGWIPRYSAELLFIPKASVTLIEEVGFDPPIDGVVNKLTTIYERAPGHYHSEETKVQPNTLGNVVQPGDAVKISRREGDYYIVTLPGAPKPAMLPIDAVTVAAEALATGKAILVPPAPAPTAPTAQAAPQPGSLFGRLKVPYTLNGTALAPGSYVTVAYDGGDHWVLSGSDPRRNPTIAKAAVEIISRVDFETPLIGQIKSATKLFKLSTNTDTDPSTLNQSEIIDSMNPRLKPGDIVYIGSREGNDYIVEVQIKEYYRGRVPASAVEIVAGSPESGVPVTVAPLPQSNNPSVAGYVVPPPKQEEEDNSGFGNGLLLFAVASVVMGIAGAVYRSSINASSAGKDEAEYGVPHTNFKRIADGFEVRFCRSSPAFHGLTHAFQNLQQGGASPIGAIVLIVLMVVLIFVVILWYGIESFFPTKIVVDKDSVRINGKTMRRSDFGGFNVPKTITGGPITYAVLGYAYGRRNFTFGGVWPHATVLEVASALNSDLRVTPLAGDEVPASPEALRAARPTDF